MDEQKQADMIAFWFSERTLFIILVQLHSLVLQFYLSHFY